MLARTRPGTGGALRLAAELVDGGFSVALEPDGEDLRALCAGLVEAGLADHCEVTVPVDGLAGDEIAALAHVGPDLALSGPPSAVVRVLPRVPGARVVVQAAEPGAEAWCRSLAGRRVRLAAGRGERADLAFVRCLNVLMAGSGHPAVATPDPGLLALTAERAAWNDRTPDSWEHVMPDRARSSDARRLLAAGYRVRVVVGSRR